MASELSDPSSYRASIGAYAAIREHASGCLQCLGETVLTLASYRLIGDLNFEPVLCADGERLMAALGAACALDDAFARSERAH